LSPTKYNRLIALGVLAVPIGVGLYLYSSDETQSPDEHSAEKTVKTKRKTDSSPPQVGQKHTVRNFDPLLLDRTTILLPGNRKNIFLNYQSRKFKQVASLKAEVLVLRNQSSVCTTSPVTSVLRQSQDGEQLIYIDDFRVLVRKEAVLTKCRDLKIGDKVWIAGTLKPRHDTSDEPYLELFDLFRIRLPQNEDHLKVPEGNTAGADSTPTTSSPLPKPCTEDESNP